jgi:hypothetical protein
MGHYWGDALSNNDDDGLEQLSLPCVALSSYGSFLNWSVSSVWTLSFQADHLIIHREQGKKHTYSLTVRQLPEYLLRR